MDSITKEKTVSHPLEDILDIEPCTTVVEYEEFMPAEIVLMPEYDDKDNEIESKLEEIYTLALGNVSVLSDEIETVEGKYKARMGEVTATMLNVALGAVKQKADLKAHKDKMVVDKKSAGTPHTVNNNLVVSDRNSILRALADKNK
jgi:hypothetical protein